MNFYSFKVLVGRATAPAEFGSSTTRIWSAKRPTLLTETLKLPGP